MHTEQLLTDLLQSNRRERSLSAAKHSAVVLSLILANNPQLSEVLHLSGEPVDEGGVARVYGRLPGGIVRVTAALHPIPALQILFYQDDGATRLWSGPVSAIRRSMDMIEAMAAKETICKK